MHLLQSADAEQGSNNHGEPVSPQLPGSKAHSHSAAFSFIHTHTTGAGVKFRPQPTGCLSDRTKESRRLMRRAGWHPAFVNCAKHARHTLMAQGKSTPLKDALK